MKEVVLIFRKPFTGQVSIEYLFYSISAYLKKAHVPIVNRELAHYSNTVLKRFKNLFSVTGYRNKIVHVTGDVHYALLGAWFCKRVLTIHDLGFMVDKGRAAKFVYWLLWVYLPVKFAHRVTVVSENTRRDLEQYMTLDDDKVQVIGNFIDEVYQAAPRPVTTSTLRLLQIGTAPNKNIKRLAGAIAGLDCVLTVVGKLPENTIRELELHQVKYENKYNLSVADLYEVYKQSDLLCYVSTLEGFGLPILEAQATGLPVLCANCSAMPEVAGAGAYFVDPLDVDAIRNGISTLSKDMQLQKALIEKGYENAKKYSKNLIAKEYLKLYQGLSNH